MPTDVVEWRIAVSLREDVRSYLPELLPKFTKLFEDAERSGKYEMVPQALRTLEALGPALEAHLQLLLPALVRLICPGDTGAANRDGRPLRPRAAAHVAGITPRFNQ